jgi:chromosome segregation ATPase
MKMKKVSLLVALTLAAGPAAAAFRCVDEKGRTHIGDTPPPGCANVVMYEVTRGGIVIRKIEPSITEEQAKAKLEAEEKQRQLDKIAAEQKRKDTALLSTYGSEKEFDTARDRNIEPLKARIVQSQERLKEIDKRTTVVKEEMEFYTAGKKKGSGKKNDTPAAMTSELERLNEEKAAIHKGIVGYEKEIVELRNKYDTDRRRWAALKAGKGSAPPESTPPSEAKAEPVKADAKAPAKK